MPERRPPRSTSRPSSPPRCRLFIAIIVVLAIILLAIAFRSLLVPLKAVLGFLLSIAASLGLVVWVFQEGHAGGLLSVAAAAPIVSFVPVLLIGVLFGLAMDYEVFLVQPDAGARPPLG